MKDLREALIEALRPAEPWPHAPSPETIIDTVLALRPLRDLIERTERAEAQAAAEDRHAHATARWV